MLTITPLLSKQWALNTNFDAAAPYRTRERCCLYRGESAYSMVGAAPSAQGGFHRSSPETYDGTEGDQLKKASSAGRGFRGTLDFGNN